MPNPLPDVALRRYDESPDADFYQTPRLVTHIDDRAIAAVTQIYREILPSDGKILDLMSSWISHLPAEIPYASVTGLGMNEFELRQNLRLAAWIVQDLNQTPTLPFKDGEFDGAVCCVSIDYLTRPIMVLREVLRTLKPGAPFVVTFSNRCFPTKAVAIWHTLDDAGRIALVKRYFEEAGFTAIETHDKSLVRNGTRSGDPLFAVIGRHGM